MRRVSVIIPVGPGHDRVVKRAVASVEYAWSYDHGPFDEHRVLVIDDAEAKMGRSKARNFGMDSTPKDWHFLLDADDQMVENAFTLVDLCADATFGAVCLDGAVLRTNRYPLSKFQLIRLGAKGTLSMGCFLRVGLGMRFDEEMDIAEDFDFYCRLACRERSFIKVEEPLVSIGYRTPSAGGPRSSAGCDWTEACQAVVDRYKVVVIEDGTMRGYVIRR